MNRMPGHKWFKAVWGKDTGMGGRMKLRRWLKFAKCDECIEFRTELRKAGSAAATRQVRQREAKHHDFVRRERESYWSRRDAARNLHTRGNALSLIIDAADQGHQTPWIMT
jgi:hypothetical protein